VRGFARAMPINFGVLNREMKKVQPERKRAMHQRYTQITSVSFTPEQVKELEALAKKRDWSVAKTVRESVRMAVAAAATEQHGATAA
jgi:hypothetical protein